MNTQERLNGWRVEARPWDMTVCLSNGARKAFFDTSEWLMQNGPLRLPKDPMQAMALMIQLGARPFRVEGMAIEDMRPLLALPAADQSAKP